MGRWNGVRAVLILLGFYVLAAGSFLLLAFGGGLLLGLIDNTLLFLLAALALGLLLGAGVAALIPFQAKPFVPEGVPLYRDYAPELWGVLTELADRLGTRLPDQVWATPAPEVSVVEEASWLGLRPGRRFLMVGFPVLQACSRTQLRAMLAHEFGHYAQLDGQTTVIGHRAHVAVARILARFPRSTVNPLSWLFRGYARMFILTQRAASRRREHAADVVMGQLTGRSAARSALRLVPLLGLEWHRYLHVHVEPGKRVGLAPSEVLGGFAELLAARAEWLATADEPVRAPSRWDTHPTTAERLWALESAPEVSDVDDRPALGLLGDPEEVAARLEAASFDFGDRTRLPWDRYLREAALAQLRESAEYTYRSVGRASGQPVGTLAALLELPLTEDAGAAVREAGLPAALVLAAYEAGTVRFEHRWDEDPDFVHLDGSPVDVYDLVDDLLTPEPEARERAREGLAALGIDPAAARGSTERLSPHRATITGGLATVKVNEQLGHLVITDLGLLHIPMPDAGVDSGKQALEDLMAQPTFVLAGRSGAIWLPYEEFASVDKQRDVPIKATVTRYDGTKYQIHAAYSGYVHGKSHDTILRELARHA